MARWLTWRTSSSPTRLEFPIRTSTWARRSTEVSQAPAQLQRPEALRILDRAFPDQPIILTIGGTIREMVAVCGRRTNHLPMLDSMGLATPIGLGLAAGLAAEPAI